MRLTFKERIDKTEPLKRGKNTKVQGVKALINSDKFFSNR